MGFAGVISPGNKSRYLWAPTYNWYYVGAHLAGVLAAPKNHGNLRGPTPPHPNATPQKIAGLIRGVFFGTMIANSTLIHFIRPYFLGVLALGVVGPLRFPFFKSPVVFQANLRMISSTIIRIRSWLFRVFVGDEKLPLAIWGDYFISHDIRRPINQPIFHAK